MQIKDGQLLFSPSDLITFMGSRFASVMDRKRLFDQSLSEQIDPPDPMLERLRKLGYEHEDAFLEELRKEGREIFEVTALGDADALEETLLAMNRGVEVIVQARLAKGAFAGSADFLVRVPGASALGDHHYEVWDTKLARKMKPYFAVQLCCYSEMLEAVQGSRPKSMSVILGDRSRHTLKVDAYFNYYSHLKRAFLDFHADDDAPTPDPAERREHGNWNELAARLLEERDHLSRVANLQQSQVLKLEAGGIKTMHDLAVSPAEHINGIGNATLAKAKRQARLQIASRGEPAPLYEVLEHDPEHPAGLHLLPPESPNDLFFDIEGYPGLDQKIEYLWGVTYFEESGTRTFRDFWAHDAAEEKQAFCDFIDWVYARWRDDPSMHIYHYADYEITAIRRLMGQYGVREFEVDNLLRNNVFVDLYKIVSQGLAVGEPAYSIKNIEKIYRGKRETDVASGDVSILVYEAWREAPDGETWETSPTLKSIRDYNIDDCDSTQELGAWLRDLQAENGITFIGPSPEGEKPVKEEEEEVIQLRDQLLEQAAAEADETAAQVFETMAWSLEFHRRENKPMWWRLFERLGKGSEQLYDDMDCLAHARRTTTPEVRPTRGNPIWEYRYDPDQPFKGTAKVFKAIALEELSLQAKDHDPFTGRICFSARTEPPASLDLIPDEYVRAKPIPQAIAQVASSGGQGAIRDFLARRPPRISGLGTGQLIDPEADLIEEVTTAVRNLDSSYLCIQGPPGSGKTYTAKHIICDLLASGKRIGIASNSHKAINNLLGKVAELCTKNGIEADFAKAQQDKKDTLFETGQVRHIPSAGKLKVTNRMCFGGTAWAFSNSNLKDRFDYLFVDEAGQVSIANLIGMSQSANNIVLMGDQMQLPQPLQGSHPKESGRSALDYLLQDRATIPDEIGVFLPRTYRMHPDICDVISQQVYDGRLKSDPSTQRHVIETKGPTITKLAGICYVPVPHVGNTQGSEEEVEAIVRLRDELLGSKLWDNECGTPRRLGLSDILFVAPYNYQVNKLRAALGDEAQIGSVDKFQGLEAPVVILSMCASDAWESPRGIEFLFSKNRLNVAISRAQALAIIVANPGLSQTPVSTLEQLELMNFYCALTD